MRTAASDDRSDPETRSGCAYRPRRYSLRRAAV